MGKGRITALSLASVVAAGATAAFLAPAAHADPQHLYATIDNTGLHGLGISNQTFTVHAGDTITIGIGKAPASALPPFVVQLRGGPVPGVALPVTLGPSSAGANVVPSITTSIPTTGTWSFSWFAGGLNGAQRLGSGTAAITGVPVDTPTPSDSGASTSANTGTGGPGPGGGPTGGTGGGGLPSGGTSQGNLPVNIPAPSDHGIDATATSAPHPSGSISFPTTAPSSSFGDLPTTSISTQVVVQAGAPRASQHSRPTGLAIVSILALAGVTGWYLLEYFGGVGALRGSGGTGAGAGNETASRRGPTPGPRGNRR